MAASYSRGDRWLFRTIVFLKCSDNNRALTVLEAFTQAVDDYGLPTKVRTDLGGENTEVWRYLIEQHANNSAVITGSSTHNERMLEEEERLNPLNEVDIFCLHYVFKPRINSCMSAFCESWNNHSVSTAGSRTPNQLFILGSLENNTVPQQPHLTNNSMLTTTPDTTNHVIVPRISYQPCLALSTQLSSINPLRQSIDFGCDIYSEVVNIVGQHLQLSCVSC